MFFENIIHPILEGCYIVFGNIKCFGEYMMQPVSLFGEHFVSSYSNFLGEQVSFTIPRVQIADAFGDLIALISRDTPTWVAISVIVITVGLVTSIVYKLVKMIVGLV